LRYALLILAVFNLLDGVNSSLGLFIGIIDERNPLMRSVWQVSPLLFLGIKILLSGLLIVLWLRPFPFQTKPIWKCTIYSLVVLYGMINSMHAVWIIRAAGIQLQ
jgi:hypothetical protein